MTYTCGHPSTMIVISGDALTMSTYLTWQELGSSKPCFKCWNKEKRLLEAKKE